MKTKLLLLLTLATLVFASCSKDDETDINWKENNEEAFAKTLASEKYKTIESQSKNGSIAYTALKSGDGITPDYTDQVEVLYTGWFKSVDWNRDDTFTNDDGKTITNKIIFDSTSFRDDIPSTFPVAGVVDGFSTALQHMKVGDKWQIWIPWQLGYGPTGAQGNRIPAYTTLVFEIELLKVI